MSIIKRYLATRALRLANQRIANGDLIGSLAAIGVSGELFEDVPMAEVEGIAQVRIHDLMKRAEFIKEKNK